MNKTPKQLITDMSLVQFQFSKKRKCGIYLIFCRDNEAGYIGQSKRIYDRFRSHKASLEKKIHINPRLQNIVDKHGIESLEFYIIEECPTSELTERETYYYNLLEGELRINCRHPLYVPEMTKEQIQKGLNSRKGIKRTQEQKEHLSKVMKNRYVSEETKLKMSAARKKMLQDPTAQAKNLAHLQNLAEKRRGTKLPKEWADKVNAAKIGRVHIQNKSQYLDAEKIKQIKILLVTSTLTQTEIGKKFGVSYAAVGRIKTGQSWAHVKVEGIDDEKLKETRKWKRPKKEKAVDV